MDPLQGLTDQVAQTVGAEQSAITLLGALHDALVAAGTNPAKLKALADSLASSQQALAAAVAANPIP